MPARRRKAEIRRREKFFKAAICGGITRHLNYIQGLGALLDPKTRLDVETRGERRAVKVPLDAHAMAILRLT